MLYLEDYLELIEHLPQELRDRLTLIRENDLKVNNSSQQIDTKVKIFFAEAKRLSPEQRQCNFESILKDYEKTVENADAKLELADQTSEIMVKLIQKLDGELEKFKLELEADHAGITEQLERRSLELDADSRLNHTINGFMSASSSSKHAGNFKDRRRSEHDQRHHPYHQNSNGYHARAKLSHNHHDHDGIYNISQHKYTPHQHRHGRIGNGRHQYSNSSSRQNSTATSPAPYGQSPASGPPSIAGDHDMINGIDLNRNGHYNNNLTSFGNNSGFKTSYKSHNQHYSALSAALSSASTPNTVHSNKISQNGSIRGTDYIDGTSDPSLVRQNPLAAAASQAIAATQQLQQGRRTPSLKASFAAINAAGLGHQLDHLGYTNRNALAPMAPDQQADRYNQQYGKLNGNSNPLYVSVTKSGRPTKRPKHHASHIYPDESPVSISSDNSVFENSESLSSAEFLHEQSPAFGSSSPSSFDYSRSHLNDQSGGASGEYQLDQTKYCICRQVSYGGMVACDNEDCEIQWFHFGCVGLSDDPPGKWYCPECLISMGIQHKKNQARSQPQQKKRGRKEKSAFNLMGNSSRDQPQMKVQERVVSAE